MLFKGTYLSSNLNFWLGTCIRLHCFAFSRDIEVLCGRRTNNSPVSCSVPCFSQNSWKLITLGFCGLVVLISRWRLLKLTMASAFSVPTLLYPPMFPVISRPSFLLISLGFACLIVYGIPEETSANIQQKTRNRWYLSFVRFMRHGFTLGSCRWVQYLCSALNIQSESEHFVKIITALKASNENEFCDQCWESAIHDTWFARRCCHRLD